MSWLFSQALVAAYSQATSTVGAACAPLNVTPTAHSFWRQGKMMDASRLSRFGLTCAVLTADRGAALLTWYRADFLARTSAPQAKAQASTAHAAACGAKWPASSVRYCPVTSSWRTHHCLFDAALPASSLILPRWGMTRTGVVCPHPTLARPINATASGLWPTPNCTGYRSDGELRLLARKARNGEEFLAMSHRACRSKQQTWFPTPTASQHKGWSPNHNRAHSDDRLDYTIERQANQQGHRGRLNPQWVEWLMGWPIGWTDLRPLATDRFQEWQQQHSNCSATPAEFAKPLQKPSR